MLIPSKTASASWIFLWAIVASGVAGADCPASGVGTKLKLPLVAGHTPCGYKGREADQTTSYGPACSPAATGLKTCSNGDYACASNSDCSAMTCYSSGFTLEGPCDTQADCGYCDNNGNPCGDTPMTCLASAGTCVNADDTYDTDYKFGERGACTLSAKSKAAANCAIVQDHLGFELGLPAGPCHVTFFSVRCKDILRSDATPVNGNGDDGFTLHLTVRLSLDDGSTVLDVPIIGRFDTPDEGTLNLSTSTAEEFVHLFGTAEAALPTCTVLEIVRAEIRDPFDRIFAKTGLATR